MEHSYVGALQGLCAYPALCLSTRVRVFVCRCVTTPMSVHASVCVTVNLRVNRRHEEADGYFCVAEGSLPGEA